MKKILIALMTVVVLAAITVSCAGDNSTVATTAAVTTDKLDNAQTTAQPTTAAVTTAEPEITDDPDYLNIVSNGSTKYKVISSEDRSSKVRNLATNLSKRIETKFDVECKSLLDTEAEDSPYEILIGETNRPETVRAKELMGDNDYIITVINNKLVVYSAVDNAYVQISEYVLGLIGEDDFILDRDYSRIRKYKFTQSTDVTVESGKVLSMDLVFESEKSAVQLHLTDKNDSGVGYMLVIDEGLISFSRLGEENEILASKRVLYSAERSYTVRFDFDGEYLRFYFINDPEGYEPWPEFEVKLGNVSDLLLYYSETSGYGILADNIKTYDYVSDIDENTVTYQNNVVKGLPDPEVFEHEGVYYMIGTGRKYPVYKSLDLITWTYVGEALPEVSWEGTFAYWWAPDVEYIDGKFYMCISLSANMFGFAVSDKPEGPYTCVGESFGSSIIDGNLFVDDDGKVYLYYTSWNGSHKYGIYAVEMEDDYITPKWETETLLITPTEAWEKDQGSVTEGAYMMKHEGKYYLLYSGSNYVGNYALGYAVSDSPNKGFKKATENPILCGTADAKGVGHVSVVLAPDGETLVMAYHRHVSSSVVDPRNVCIDPMRFVKQEDGSYTVEVYGPTVSKRPATWMKK